MYRTFSAFFALVSLLSCNNEQDKPFFPSTKVNVHFENAYNQKAIVEKVPILGQRTQKLDSVFIEDRVETQMFEIKDSSENLYYLRIANSPVKIVFINDAPEIDLYIDFFDPDSFRIERSPASISLHHFLSSMRRKNNDNGNTGTEFPYATGIDQPTVQQYAYRNFVDTVSSPASALYIFSAVDYGNDHSGLSSLINGLYKRFPNHAGISQLKKETEDYLSIFEDELNVNDIAPDLSLPDSSGKELSLSSLKGRYILLDFWAGWNTACRMQSAEKVQAWEKYRSTNFTIVSVSLDPDSEYWKKVIVADKYSWPQLNDPNVWTGKAIKAYKFDSIPFNFLINPEGRIIAKAIYGDSLRKKLSEILR